MKKQKAALKKDDVVLIPGSVFLFRLEDEFEWSVREGHLEAVSPSQNYVRVSGCWFPVYRIRILEILYIPQEEPK